MATAAAPVASATASVTGDVGTLGNQSDGILVQSRRRRWRQRRLQRDRLRIGSGRRQRRDLGRHRRQGRQRRQLRHAATSTARGNVTTAGNESRGVVVQSIGGGGGNGGLNVDASGSGAGVGSGAISVGVGGVRRRPAARSVPVTAQRDRRHHDRRQECRWLRRTVDRRRRRQRRAQRDGCWLGRGRRQRCGCGRCRRQRRRRRRRQRRRCGFHRRARHDGRLLHRLPRASGRRRRWQRRRNHRRRRAPAPAPAAVPCQSASAAAVGQPATAALRVLPSR